MVIMLKLLAGLVPASLPEHTTPHHTTPLPHWLCRSSSRNVPASRNSRQLTSCKFQALVTAIHLCSAAAAAVLLDQESAAQLGGGLLHQ